MNLLFLRVCLQSCPAVSLKNCGWILFNTPATFSDVFVLPCGLLCEGWWVLVLSWGWGKRRTLAIAVYLLNSLRECFLFSCGVTFGLSSLLSVEPWKMAYLVAFYPCWDPLKLDRGFLLRGFVLFFTCHCNVDTDIKIGLGVLSCFILLDHMEFICHSVLTLESFF